MPESVDELEREVRRHQNALNRALERILAKLRNGGKVEERQGSPETAPPDSE